MTFTMRGGQQGEVADDWGIERLPAPSGVWQPQAVQAAGCSGQALA